MSLIIIAAAISVALALSAVMLAIELRSSTSRAQ
jgi:hypothetical protein